MILQSLIGQKVNLWPNTAVTVEAKILEVDSNGTLFEITKGHWDVFVDSKFYVSHSESLTFVVVD